VWKRDESQWGVCDSGDVESEQHEDVELVRRVAARDPEALRALYGRYGRLVYSIAYRVLRDRQHAEDCTQDTFVALWRHAKSYEPGRARVTTWLFTLTRNTAIDAVRRLEVRRADPLPEGDGWSPGVAADTADLVAAADAAARVAEALAVLSPAQREAVSLAFFDGLSHREIAERLGVPPGTVKGRIRLGLDRLRELAPSYALETEARR